MSPFFNGCAIWGFLSLGFLIRLVPVWRLVATAPGKGHRQHIGGRERRVEG
jgi:hypothetical protein